MDDTAVYRQATGQDPPVSAAFTSSGEPGDLSDDDVLAVITLYAGAAAASAFPVRRAPEDGQPHPGDRVFVSPVELKDGRYLAVAWRFGQPDPDEMLTWKVRWHSVAGPLDLPALQELARGLMRS